MIADAVSVLSILADLADILIAGATYLGLWYAFRQYEASKLDQIERQKEHRLSVAQGAISQMQRDEMAQFAATTLDWAVGIVPVPHDWRDVVGHQQQLDRPGAPPAECRTRPL